MSASEYDGVVQQLASARLEQVSACQQRDETLQNYMELEEDSSRIIQGLRQVSRPAHVLMQPEQQLQHESS